MADARTPRRAKSRGHGLGRASGVARRGHRVDLDKLLVDVDGQLLLSAPALCMYRVLEPGQTHQRTSRQHEMPCHPIPPIDLCPFSGLNRKQLAAAS